jgi:cytochrome c
MKRTTLFAAALMAAAAAVTGPALADGDADKGAKVFNKCKACHVADEAKNKVGPSLHGVFGRKAGTVEGFKYSDAMKEADVVWSEETIAEYVKKPKDFIPGNKMSFAGLKKDDQIEDLIAFLKVETVK